VGCVFNFRVVCVCVHRDKEQAEKRKKKNLHPMRLLDAAKKVQEQHGITNHGVGVHKRSVHDRTIRMWNNCHYSGAGVCICVCLCSCGCCDVPTHVYVLSLTPPR
jgi:hypothetical protein